MAEARAVEVNHRKVLGLAIPMTLAHLTTPLVGFVDLAVIGQLGEAPLIGAITIGAVLFDFVFWPFGFLRMGTAGLTAQALGAGDEEAQRIVLARALLLSAACALFLLLFSWPAREAGLLLAGGSADIQETTRRYFAVRVWSVPFVFINYTLLGWLIGMGRTGFGLAAQIVLNLANIAGAATFTLGMGLGVEGLAYAAILAEAVGALTNAAFVAYLLKGRLRVSWQVIADPQKLTALMGMNGDIMLRSLLLLGGFLFFTRQGAAAGDVAVAANGLLMNLFLMGAYTLDGFATAAEQLCGRALGAQNLLAFRRATDLTRYWSLGYGVLIGLLFLVAGPAIIAGMTGNEEVRAGALAVMPFAAAAPLAGALAFQLDGVFIGATWTVAMRNMMLLSFVLYIAAYELVGRHFGNAGLWASFLLFLAVRGLSLALAYQREFTRSFGRA